MTCYGKPAIAVPGQYANVGTVTAVDLAGTPIGIDPAITDPSHYFGVQSSIDVEKATNGEDADNAPGPYLPVGSPVTWTYVVTNTGNTELTGPRARGHHRRTRGMSQDDTRPRGGDHLHPDRRRRSQTSTPTA